MLIFRYVMCLSYFPNCLQLISSNFFRSEKIYLRQVWIYVSSVSVWKPLTIKYQTSDENSSLGVNQMLHTVWAQAPYRSSIRAFWSTLVNHPKHARKPELLRQGAYISPEPTGRPEPVSMSASPDHHEVGHAIHGLSIPEAYKPTKSLLKRTQF